MPWLLSNTRREGEENFVLKQIEYSGYRLNKKKQEASLLARKGLPLGCDHHNVSSQVQVTRNRYDRYDDNGNRRRP